MSEFNIRLARPEDQAAAYYVCLKTGDHGRDGEPFYRDDPDALGRIFVGPYLAFAPELSLVVENESGVCGYCLAAVDSRSFYARYEREWRPQLCAQFPAPSSDRSQWTRAETVHSWYHEPDYFCPEPYDEYPSHMHIDLLERARGSGIGRTMMERQMDELQRRGSPGGHVNVSVLNAAALPFYAKLGFHELVRTASSVYLGRRL
jgi:GNAT superfamily N-acetyltransferase